MASYLPETDVDTTTSAADLTTVPLPVPVPEPAPQPQQEQHVIDPTYDHDNQQQQQQQQEQDIAQHVLHHHQQSLLLNNDDHHDHDYKHDPDHAHAHDNDNDNAYDHTHHHSHDQQHHLHHDHDHEHDHGHDHQPATTASAVATTTYDDGLPSLPAIPATNATVAVAHHGLQVLQAASAAPMQPLSPSSNDLAQQYAQSAALQMGEPHFPPLGTAVISPPGAGSHASSQKVTRLRRACDMCSQRKVKCDESGPPCKPCSDLQVECTFRREMKRRGPPNKHAEAARAAKRIQYDNTNDASPPIPHNAADALVSAIAHEPPRPPTLDGDAIAPWPVLQLWVDDFFTYIHPVLPFPHEPSFRQAFASRADRTDREFLALLASMIAVLIASFPRAARAHLKNQNITGSFPTTVTMIDHCLSIAAEARGPLFTLKQDTSIDDAAASYFLGLAASHTMRWKQYRGFLAETMSFCRELGTHRPQDATMTEPLDHVNDQIGKRIFWAMVAGNRSMGQIEASINELPLPPPTTQKPYPEQPAEVDDEYIYPDQILPQPEGTISLITGFNKNNRIYMTMNELIGVEMCYGINFFDWIAQKNILSNGLVSARQAIEDLPPSLQIGKAEPGQNGHAELDHAGLHYCPPAFPASQPENDVRQALADPVRRRQLQCEIQKTNIQASQLATRSYFVERYLNLRDAHAENTSETKNSRDEMVAEERESIIQDLLAVLISINQRSLEPNGQSVTKKIRHVASTLVESASERKGPIALKAEDDLHRFIEVLAKLERTDATAVVGAAIDTSGAQDEEEELGNWAILRERQLQLMSSGVLFGDE
ncbi:hypothetical protein F4808DRAFT_3290 [Astrocystis sublimbata]|nr:hypothetical protein F4808DRAFT_3290 [Astrocystis sublimbata]